MAKQSAARRVTEGGDWESFISGDPRILDGKPVITGTRVPVSIVVGSVGGGMTVAEVMEEYRLTQDQVHAALSYAASLADEERIVPLPPR